MARSSIREELKRRPREHLALAETHPPEECPLDVRSVATALRISPTTLYKYAFNREIKAAEQCQRENMWLSGAAIEQQFYTDRIRDLTAELQQERQRSKNLIARIAIMEANAARLGFDAEEMYKPILKPLRGVSRAGSGGKWHGRIEPVRFDRRASSCFGVQSLRHVMEKNYTEKQGQYLAFIYYYSKIHGHSPSEAEMQQYFRVSPPSVHQMILTLETRGLIKRTPGQARSIHLLIPREELPDLE